MNKLNIFLFILESIIIIVLLICLIFSYSSKLLPEKNKLELNKINLQTKNTEIHSQENDKKKLKENHSIIVNNNKDNFEVYKKWKEKNQTIKQYL